MNLATKDLLKEVNAGMLAAYALGLDETCKCLQELRASLLAAEDEQAPRALADT